MEKLKRLQAGEDVSDLLAEMDDDMPSDAEEEEEEDPEEYGLTEVQKKVSEINTLFITIMHHRPIDRKSCLMWMPKRRKLQCRGRWS